MQMTDSDFTLSDWRWRLDALHCQSVTEPTVYYIKTQKNITTQHETKEPNKAVIFSDSVFVSRTLARPMKVFKHGDDTETTSELLDVGNTLAPSVFGSLRAKPGCGCPAWQRRH